MKPLVVAVFSCMTMAAAAARSRADCPFTPVPRGVTCYPLAEGEDLRGITMDEENDRIYIAGGSAQKVFRVDVTAHSATWTSWDTDRPLAFIAPDDPFVWANSYYTDTLFRVDTRDGSIDYPDFPGEDTAVMHGPLGLQVLDGVLWVAFHDGHTSGSVARLDPDTMEVLCEPNRLDKECPLQVGPSGGGGPNALVATPSGVWVSVPGFAQVIRIDPADGTLVAAIPTGASCDQLTVTGDSVYIASGDPECGPPGVRRIDVATNLVDAAPVYTGGAVGVAAGFGSIWVSDSDRQVLVRIHPATRAIIGELSIPAISHLAVGFGSLWAITGTGYLVRLEPGRI